MKKVFSLLLVAVLLIGCMAMNVFAAENPQFTVSKETANRGETVQVTVSTTAITYQDYALYVNYDTSALTYVSAAAGNATHGTFKAQENELGKIKVGCFDNAEVEYIDGGTLFTIYFTVDSDAACGTYDVTLTIDTVVNQADEELSVGVTNGSVTVNHIAGAAATCTSAQTCTKCGAELAPVKDHTDSATDNDHVCDYGCGTTVEACSDKAGDGDHKCDVCGKDGVTSCYDSATDKDHVCDECGKDGITEHKDSATDGDHVCDNGCGAILEDCSDKANDGDHNCDVCGKKIGNCSDSATDKDHVCDECGGKIEGGETCSDKTGDGDHKCDVCGKDGVTSCSDVNTDKDHKCDECGKDGITEHKDSATDGDHVCDNGCGAILEDCSDKANDGDHNCDVCGKKIGSCSDSATDKDHVCDECGGKIEGGETCSDKAGDKDHNCDVCGEKIGSCSDSATDKDHVCDECGGEIENGEKCSDATGDKDHKCDVCGKDGVSDHTWDKGTVTKEPGCGSKGDGEMTFTCTECGKTKTETINKDSCVDKNNDGKCDVCGEKMKDSQPKNGDITPYFVMAIVTMISMCAAVVYLFKRKFVK